MYSSLLSGGRRRWSLRLSRLWDSESPGTGRISKLIETSTLQLSQVYFSVFSHFVNVADNREMDKSPRSHSNSINTNKLSVYLQHISGQVRRLAHFCTWHVLNQHNIIMLVFTLPTSKTQCPCIQCLRAIPTNKNLLGELYSHVPYTYA